MRGSNFSRGGDSARRHNVRRSTLSYHQATNGLEALECRTLMAVDVTPTFQVGDDWGSGFIGDIKLDSHESSAITPWRLEFDMAANITSIWNAKIESHTGNHYTIVGASWNSALAPNGSVEFGFVAAPLGGSVTPTGYVLNGTALDGSAPVLPSLSISDVTLTEGDSGTSNAVFTVSLSAPSSTAVSVAYATADGTASAASDYQARTGTLQFAAGETAKTITVQVSGDTTVEANETLFVDLSQPSGATLAQTRGTATITNDDVEAQPSGDIGFEVVSNWGSGFTGQVTIHNSGATTVQDWRLEFDFAGSINSIWNGTIESHTGNHYVIKNAGYNANIAAGGATSFGFVASPGGTAATLSGFILNGEGTTPAVNRAPVAVNDAAFARLGQEVLINVLANDTDPDGDTLTLIAADGAAHGTVTIEAGQVLYQPNSGYTGSDSFTYQVRDEEGLTASATVNVTIADVTTNSGQMFAPYVDMGLWPTYDLVSAARDYNIQYFTLAFIVADPTGQPSWAGYSEYGLGTDYDAQMRTQIDGVRALGGDVIVSFGGAANQELALVITDPVALQAAYQAVIDAYGLTQIDFDIEGAAVGDKASIDRRNEAIAGLQRDAIAAGRTLEVSYTLPVLPTGVTSDGLYVLQSAVSHGVNLSVVNIMAMDYGDGAAPNPQGQMGDYAIQAANSLFSQLQSVYGTAKADDELWSMVGITPMIGVNDLTSEVFDQQEAREVLAFAEQHAIGRLSFWSLNRDQQNASGELSYVDNNSSSILQDPFEFSQIFGTFDD